MDNDLPPDPYPGYETETAEKRAARIRWEAQMIAKGHADIEAGLGIEDDDLEAWLDALELDENAPMPAPKAFRP